MVARVVVRDAPKVPQVLADWESEGIFCLAAPSDPQEVVVGRGCLGERLLLGTQSYTRVFGCGTVPGWQLCCHKGSFSLLSRGGKNHL